MEVLEAVMRMESATAVDHEFDGPLRNGFGVVCLWWSVGAGVDECRGGGLLVCVVVGGG